MQDREKLFSTFNDMSTELEVIGEDVRRCLKINKSLQCNLCTIFSIVMAIFVLIFVLVISHKKKKKEKCLPCSLKLNNIMYVWLHISCFCFSSILQCPCLFYPGNSYAAAWLLASGLFSCCLCRHATVCSESSNKSD